MEEERNGMEELYIIGGNGMGGRTKEGKKVGTLTVHGKQVIDWMRDDKTEVKSLVLPKTKKVAMLLASMLNYV